MNFVLCFVLFVVILRDSDAKISRAKLMDSVDYNKKKLYSGGGGNKFKGLSKINPNPSEAGKTSIKTIMANDLNTPIKSSLLKGKTPIFGVKWSDEKSLIESSNSQNQNEEHFDSISEDFSETSSSSDDSQYSNSNSNSNDEWYNLSVQEASKRIGLPNVIEKCVTKGDLALTFDDGLSKYTQEVLNILKREHAPATFFIIGNTLDSNTFSEQTVKSMLSQMMNDGHIIASHSYSHPNFDNYWPEGISHEMNRAKGLFQKYIGKAPRFMRPPYGNASPRSIKSLNDLGYFIIRWNVDTNDWMHKGLPHKSFNEFRCKVPDEKQIMHVRFQKNALELNSILDSKITLMHDAFPDVVSFLPQLIRHSRELGYRLVSMEECIGGFNPYF